MEIEIEASRKLSRLIQTLPHDLLIEVLTPLGLTEDVEMENIFSFLDDQRDGDWSISDYKVIWGLAELGNFFTSWVQPYLVKPVTTSIRKLRSKIKNEHLKNDNLITVEMSYDPQIFFIARTPDTYRALVDKTLTTEDIRDSVYWIPELGILLTKIHNDKDGKLFKNIIENNLTGNFKEFRIKSLVVTRLFKTDRNINELVVSADPQISGFEGLKEIKFAGPDVKKGLAGLYRRHDIRVNIHQIGPNIAVENQHLRLRIGSKLKVKSIEGIIELHMLMYPDLYPSEDQIKEITEQYEQVSQKNDEIMQLKRENFEDLSVVEEEIKALEKERNELKKIKLSLLANKWGIDQFRLEYAINKAIENGKINARFVEDALIKR